MRKFIFIMLLVPCSLLAEELSVNVQDELGNPIPGAIVWVGPDNTVSHQTDDLGHAEFELNNNQEYMIVAKHLDYNRIMPLSLDLKTNTEVFVNLSTRDSFRIASFNVYGNKGDGEWTADQIIPLAKIFWTVQPDIILLQECPQFGFSFEDFQSQYMPGYHSAISPNLYYVGNGICSFFPIKSSYYLGKYDLTRDLWCAVIEVNDFWTLTCMSVHLKAGGSTEDCNKRNQEAEFIVDYCQELDDDQKDYVLGGDLNEDIAQIRAPSDIFNILSQAKMTMLDPRDDENSDGTWVGSTIEKRYDYLMPNNHLAGVEEGATVFRTETMKTLPTWLDYDDCAMASDHRLIYADFKMLPEPSIFCIPGILLIYLCFFKNK